MRQSILLATAFLSLYLSSGTATGQTTYTPVEHSTLQELYYNENIEGYASYFHDTHKPPTRYAHQVIGVVINNPGDMLNYTYDAATNLKPEWQTYIQAINPVEHGIAFDNADGAWNGFFNDWDDFGGTAMYMGMYGPSGKVYEPEPWETEEMDRLNEPLLYPSTDDYVTLKQGDVVQVKAKAPGAYYNGKYNINERHSISADNNFYVEVLHEGFDVESLVSDITLADLKNSSNAFIFDETEQSGNPGHLTRGAGCEHYQGTLVHLDNLTIQDGDADNWELYGKLRDGNDKVVPIVVEQTEGGVTRTFNMVLGVNPALEMVDADLLESTPFSITAILDQEGGISDGYRLWLLDATGLPTVPEPSGFMLMASGGLAWLLWRRRKSLIL